MPLVPKELIVPVCQRLAFILFVMCGTALGIRLFALWKMGKLGHYGPRVAALSPVNGTRFFLDIGNAANNGISPTKQLEESGWKGVCASPFPSTERSCKAISMPVVPTEGDQVEVDDCAQSSPLQVLMSAVATIDCPKVVRAGVGIVDLLQLSKAPPVIDYLALETDGSELSILKRFPFDEFCVRAWTVGHKADATDTHKLLTSRGCKVKDVGPAYWARCPCSSESLLQVRAEAPRHSQRHRKKSSPAVAAIVPSGVLPVEPAETDPLGESSRMLGGSSGLGGSLLRRSFA